MSNLKGNLKTPSSISKALGPNFDYKTAGRRVRERRLQFGLSTERLAKVAGVARYTVVRVEQGYPFTKKTLQRISKALHLFSDQVVRPFPENEKFSVHRGSETQWSVSIAKARYQKQQIDEDPIHVNDSAERKRLGQLGLQPFFTAILDSELPDGLMNQALMELHRPSWVDTHFGNEFIYCLRGPVLITVDGEKCLLEQGDGMCFDANLPHQYEPGFEVKEEPALILVVVVKRPGERTTRPVI